MKRVFTAIISALFLVSILATPSYARNNNLKKALIGIGIGVGIGLLANEANKKRKRRYRNKNTRKKARHRRNRTTRQGAHTRRASNRKQKKRLQDTLNLLGYDAGTADGVFGRQTREAIKQFQESRGERGTGRLTDKQRGFLLGTNHKGNIYARPHYQKPSRNPTLTGYVPRNTYGSDRQLNEAIRKCEHSYKDHGGGYAHTAQKILAQSRRCQEVATQNYRQRSKITQHNIQYTSGKNAPYSFGENITSVAMAKARFEKGENPYLILALMKKSFIQNKMRNLSKKQRRWLSLVKFSLKDQPLLNYRDALNRIANFSALVDLWQPNVVTTINGGRNSIQNDKHREVVGTLYEGELFIYNGDSPNSGGRTSSYGLAIDNASNYLKNFFSQQVRHTFTIIKDIVAADNLQLSNDIDMNRLVTTQVDRRANHSDIESKRLGEGLRSIGSGLKKLGGMSQ